tara:strand:+ start:1067 stop:1267 length:201 start_codon:yes stop_codon:yes gene_type:complete
MIGVEDLKTGIKKIDLVDNEKDVSLLFQLFIFILFIVFSLFIIYIIYYKEDLDKKNKKDLDINKDN